MSTDWPVRATITCGIRDQKVHQLAEPKFSHHFTPVESWSELKININEGDWIAVVRTGWDLIDVFLG
jgi:hypothetical protein